MLSFVDSPKCKFGARLDLIIENIPHLINLGDHSINHFPFKWAEYNGLVLHWIEDKPSSRLDYTCTNVVNCGDCNHKAIPKGNLKFINTCVPVLQLWYICIYF